MNTIPNIAVNILILIVEMISSPFKFISSFLDRLLYIVLRAFNLLLKDRVFDLDRRGSIFGFIEPLFNVTGVANPSCSDTGQVRSHTSGVLPKVPDCRHIRCNVESFMPEVKVLPL